MKNYFVLQFKMLNRQLSEWGIEPAIAYFIGLPLFVWISLQLFEKTQYAEYLVLILAFSALLQLNETKRNDFLKLYFSKTAYLKIRLFENVLVSSLFILLLIYEKQYFSALLLFISACILVFIAVKYSVSVAIPTPFYKYPFEFLVGFRSNFMIYIFAYALTSIAILVNNFNLGIFSLVLILFLCLHYYTTTENEFYVWIFSLTPKEFIRYKLKTIVIYSSALCAPTIIVLSFFFTPDLAIIVGFYFLGVLFIFTTMLAKYSVFPDKITIKFGITFVLIIWFPPFLVAIIPYLYHQSIKKLNNIL